MILKILFPCTGSIANWFSVACLSMKRYFIDPAFDTVDRLSPPTRWLSGLVLLVVHRGRESVTKRTCFNQVSADSFV